MLFVLQVMYELFEEIQTGMHLKKFCDFIQDSTFANAINGTIYFAVSSHDISIDTESSVLGFTH